MRVTYLPSAQHCSKFHISSFNPHNGRKWGPGRLRKEAAYTTGKVPSLLSPSGPHKPRGTYTKTTLRECFYFINVFVTPTVYEHHAWYSEELEAK